MFNPRNIKFEDWVHQLQFYKKEDINTLLKSFQDLFAFKSNNQFLHPRSSTSDGLIKYPLDEHRRTEYQNVSRENYVYNLPFLRDREGDDTFRDYSLYLPYPYYHPLYLALFQFVILPFCKDEKEDWDYFEKCHSIIKILLKRDNYETFRILELFLNTSSFPSQFKYHLFSSLDKESYQGWLKGKWYIFKDLSIFSSGENWTITLIDTLIIRIFGLTNSQSLKNKGNHLFNIFEILLDKNEYSITIDKYKTLIVIINYLLNKGFPINHTDQDGNTIFHLIFSPDRAARISFYEDRVPAFAPLKLRLLEDLQIKKYIFSRNKYLYYPLTEGDFNDYYHLFRRAIKHRDNDLMEDLLKQITNREVQSLRKYFLNLDQLENKNEIVKKIDNYLIWVKNRNWLIFNKIKDRIFPLIPKDICNYIIHSFLYPQFQDHFDSN